MKIDHDNADYIRGQHFTAGVWDRLLREILLVIIVLWFVTLAYNALNLGVDDTDKSAWERSGLTILTDQGTGREYLYKGGILIERPRKP
jgi:hypothetical protein